MISALAEYHPSSTIGEDHDPTAHDMPDLASYKDPVSERAALNRIMVTEAMRAIQALPKPHRDTITMVCIQGYSYLETAEHLGISIGTVMSRIHTARQRLKEQLL